MLADKHTISPDGLTYTITVRKGVKFHNGKVMDAKGRIDQSARGAVSQVGLAAADELKELRKQIERLERRLAKLETTETKPAAKKTTAKKSETKKTPTAKKRTTVKKDAEKAPSPPPGRAIGGGSGRGSSAG